MVQANPSLLDGYANGQALLRQEAMSDEEDVGDGDTITTKVLKPSLRSQMVSSLSSIPFDCKYWRYIQANDFLDAIDRVGRMDDYANNRRRQPHNQYPRISTIVEAETPSRLVSVLPEWSIASNDQ